jgi:hypothetical protein
MDVERNSPQGAELPVLPTSEWISEALFQTADPPTGYEESLGQTAYLDSNPAGARPSVNRIVRGRTPIGSSVHHHSEDATAQHL